MGELKLTYIVVCQSAWCNSGGFGIDYSWDGEEFPDRAQAIKHGFALRESDDFNVAVLSGRRLVSFDWMDHSVGNTDEDLREIAAALGLTFRAALSTTLQQEGSEGG